MNDLRKKYPAVPKNIIAGLRERFEAARNTDEQFALCNATFREVENLSKALHELISNWPSLTSGIKTAKELVALEGEKFELKRNRSLTRGLLDQQERRVHDLREQEHEISRTVHERLNEGISGLTKKTRKNHGTLFWEVRQDLCSARHESHAVAALAKLEEAFASAPSGLMTIFR